MEFYWRGKFIGGDQIAIFPRSRELDSASRAEAVIFVEARRKQFATRGTPLPASDLELVTQRIGRFRRQVDRDRYLDGLRKAGLSD
jgi:hypothetical protein